MNISGVLNILKSYAGWTLDDFAEDPSGSGGFIRLRNRKDNIRATFDITYEDDACYISWRINQVPAEGLDYYAVIDLINTLEHIRHDIEDKMILD